MVLLNFELQKDFEILNSVKEIIEGTHYSGIPTFKSFSVDFKQNRNFFPQFI